MEEDLPRTKQADNQNGNIGEKRPYLGAISGGREYIRSSLKVSQLNQKTQVAVPLFLRRRGLGGAI